MINLTPLGNRNANIKNLDLTNAILAQMIMFLYDSDKYLKFNQNDKISFKNDGDKKLVNNLINSLLDEEIDTNEKLSEKINDILTKINNEHELKKNITSLLNEGKKDDLEKKENRFEELKIRTRSDSQEGLIKYKNPNGFVPLYEKPGGVENGDIEFKLIDKPATQKQLERYSKSNDWVNSKYFNIWMKKNAKHPKEIYVTKLVNLLYKEEEALYKVRSIKQKNRQEPNEILVKFIPNVEKYKEFEMRINNLDIQEQNKILKKIDKKALLIMSIVNFLIQNIDVNKGSILVKEQNDQIKLIPMNFGHFAKDKDFKNIINLDKQFKNFYESVANQNFDKAKDILIKDYLKKLIFFKDKEIHLNSFKKTQISIDLDYQFEQISDEEFKEVLTDLFVKYDEIKDLLEEYKKKTPEDNEFIENLENSMNGLKSALDTINLEDKMLANKYLKVDNKNETESPKNQIIFNNLQNINFNSKNNLE